MGRGRVHPELRFVVIQTTTLQGETKSRMEEVPLNATTTIQVDEAGITIVAMPLQNSAGSNKVDLRCRSQCRCQTTDRCQCEQQVSWVPEDDQLHEVMGCQVGVFTDPKAALKLARADKPNTEKKLYVVVTDGNKYEVLTIPIGKRLTLGSITIQALPSGVKIWRGCRHLPVLAPGKTHDVGQPGLRCLVRVFTERKLATEWKL